MRDNRFILEPYKGRNTRYSCPSCEDRGSTFVRYIDTQTGEHLGTNVGRCNRETKCGYHYTPSEYFRENRPGLGLNKTNTYTLVRQPLKKYSPSSIVPFEVFKQSLDKYESNHLIKFLNTSLGSTITEDLTRSYFLGTSRHWEGSTVFWQIDLEGKLRTGKIMQYNPNTGRRVKVPDNRIGWVHKALKMPGFNLNQCFFGEHLLRDKTRFVALVESEKTALIASVYFPGFIWLATGGLSNLIEEKCRVLKGRTVILFPDLKGLDKWRDRTKALSHIATFIVSDLLEIRATHEERSQGLDLADYLLKFDLETFKGTQIELPLMITNTYKTDPKAEDHKQNEYSHPGLVREDLSQRSNTAKQHGELWHHSQIRHGAWTKEIEELEANFGAFKLAGIFPIGPLKLNPWTPIGNLQGFIESHIETVKAQNGNPTYLPYLKRLKELSAFLQD